MPTIERERLIAEFVLADPRLIKLIAPAGYGKTTLAVALAKPAGSVARCDCLHKNTTIDLLRGVLESLGDAMTDDARLGIADAFISLGNDEEQWLRYAERAISLDGMPAAIILDNAEALATKTDLLLVLERLFARAKPDFKLFICSRLDLPCNFSRFAGPERTMRIGPDLLRFDRVEIALLLSRVGANASIVARIETFTQGWPMLVMMLYVLAKRGRLEGYLHGDGTDTTDLYAYLVSEVFATLEPWALDTLNAVVALPDARESDLAALHHEATADRITELKASTPFLLQNAKGTLEVHPAIAENLRAGSTRGIELAEQIVATLSETQPIRAARIAAHLGDHDRAAQLLESARYFLRTPSIDLVDTVYGLPAEALIRYPAVWNLASYSRAFSRNSAEWLLDADRVLAEMPNDTPTDVRVELFSGFMNVYTQRGEFAKAIGFREDFARTPAGQDPMGQITIRFWELIADALRGGFVDRKVFQRDVGPLMRVKNLEILMDFDIFSRHERLAGDAIAERAILCRAIDEARLSGDVVLHYLTLTEALFGAWFWGEEDRFAGYVKDFQDATHPATERATTLLLAACRARATGASTGTEQLKVRAYAYLIGASKEVNHSRRSALLKQAVATADQCGQPFLAAITRVASAVVDEELASAALAEAQVIAHQTWSDSFQKAIDSVVSGQLSGHMLQAFIERFREPLPASPVATNRVQLSLLSGSVRLNDRKLSLSAREYELLSFLALHIAPSTAEFASECIWPESHSNRARSALKVTLTRLRARLGDPSIILSTSAGYVLNANLQIDILELAREKPTSSNGIATNTPTRMQIDSLRSRIATWAWGDILNDPVRKLESMLERR